MGRRKQDFFVISKDGLTYAPLSKLKFTSMPLDKGYKAFICFANINSNTTVIGLWIGETNYKNDTLDMLTNFDYWMRDFNNAKCNYQFQYGVELGDIYHWYRGSRLEELLNKKSSREIMEKFNIVI